MPVYTLRDEKTRDEWEVNMSYDVLLFVLDTMDNVSHVLQPSNFITQHGSIHSRTDTDFRSHLKAIKKKYPGNTIDNS